jgi:hypothetical protein
VSCVLNQALVVWTGTRNDRKLAPSSRPGRRIRRRTCEASLSASFGRIREGSTAVLRGLVAEAQIDPAFRTLFRESFPTQRGAVLRELITRAAPGAPADVVLDFIYGAKWYRLLDDHAPLDDAFAAEIVRVLLD